MTLFSTQGNPGYGWRIYQLPATDKLNMRFVNADGPTNSFDSSSNYNDGEWHRLFAVVSNDSFKLYIDGQLDVFDNAGGVIGDNNYPLIIGGFSSTGSRWIGQLQELTILDVPVDEAFIERDYNGGIGWFAAWDGNYVSSSSSSSSSVSNSSSSSSSSVSNSSSSSSSSSSTINQSTSSQSSESSSSTHALETSSSTSISSSSSSSSSPSTHALETSSSTSLSSPSSSSSSSSSSISNSSSSSSTSNSLSSSSISFDGIYFYDDFEGDLSKWTVSGGTPTIETDPDDGGNNALYLNANAEGITHTLSTALGSGEFEVRYRHRQNDGDGGGYVTLFDTSNAIIEELYFRNDSNGLVHYNGSGYDVIASVSWTTWYDIRVYDFDFVGNTYRISVDGVEKGQWNFRANGSADDFKKITINQNNASPLYVDDVYITPEVSSSSSSSSSSTSVSFSSSSSSTSYSSSSSSSSTSYSSSSSSSSISSSSSTSNSSSSLSSSTSNSSSSLSHTWSANNGTLADQDSNLVAYWAGEDLTDAVGSHTLTNNGSATFTSGKYNDAFTLNGSTQYMSAADSLDWDFGTGNFTISTWLKTDESGVYNKFVVASRTDYDEGSGWALQVANPSTEGHVWFTCNGLTGASSLGFDSGVAVNDNLYHHVLISRISNTFYLYIDGVEVDTASNSNTIGNDGELRIGATLDGNSNRYFDDQIDEVAIWKGYGADSNFASALYNSNVGAFYGSTYSSSSSSMSNSSSSSSSSLSNSSSESSSSSKSSSSSSSP